LLLFFAPFLLLHSEVGDKEGTNEGTSDGVVDGASEGINDGWSDGFDDGISEGKSDGKEGCTASVKMTESSAMARQIKVNIFGNILFGFLKGLSPCQITNCESLGSFNNAGP
jgi:hypothetical protein